MSLTHMAEARLSAESQIVRQVAASLDNVTAPDWLVKWLIERDTLGQIYAGWNVGKSALAVDIACRVAAGLSLAGLKTHQGSVLYIAAEGTHGIRRRFAAWRKHNNCPVANCIFVTLPPIRLPDQQIETDLSLARADIEAEHGPLALVVLDTASATMTGDQKHGKDMNDYLAALYRLFAGVTKMLLHHVGHADKTRARGASELPAACDWEFRLEETDDFDKVVRLRNTKQRDAGLHRDIYFRLAPVTLGIDEDGDDYGSVVAEYLPDYKAPETVASGSPTQEAMLSALREVTDQHRQRLADGGHDPDNARVLTGDWRKACVDMAIVKSTSFRTQRTRMENKGLVLTDGLYTRITDT